MSGAPTLAVVYAAKSTQDRRRSIDTQLEDARWKCKEEGWEVVGRPFSDEGFSAYRGNRGPDLAAAIELAAAEAARRDAPVMLVAQAVDRFARGAGDAPDSARHASELWHELRRRNVHMRTAEDDEATRDAGSIAAAGEAAMRESRRRQSATRKGLRRRAERGDAVGAIPLGYRADTRIVDGEAITRRMIDPEGAALYLRMVDMIECGHTPGQVSRRLDAEGQRTKRGKRWTTRAVRRLLTNEDHTGANGYPEIIDRARWAAVQERLTRLDPAAAQARRGGRPAPEDFILHSLAFCGACGEPMRLKRYRTGTRVYRCSGRSEGRAGCDARPVRAELAESSVLTYLHHIVEQDLACWLAAKSAERTAERDALLAAAGREHEQVAKLRRRRDRAAEQRWRLLDEGEDAAADAALRDLAAIDAAVEAQERAAADAESRAAEWQAEPSLDAALDFYNGIVELIGGRVRRASGGAELNAALRDALAGVWLEMTPEHFRADVRLRGGDSLPIDVAWAAAPTPEKVREVADRLCSFHADAGLLPEPVRATEPQTFVYDQPLRSPISSYVSPFAFIISALASSGFSARSASAERRTRSVAAISSSTLRPAAGTNASRSSSSPMTDSLRARRIAIAS
jgi:DNA invertase Pin-like site-specific DNA recombinase